ncbi:MAG: hypothetical protein ACOYYF_13045 [Chloroflexota bacterium]|nr:hypothetical protein [Chloroflexota bacterium]MBI5703397.1 hypothetical protein [Chloroflexota bacterium]
MKTILKYTGINIGFFVGLICAFLSLIVFSIIESVRMTFLFEEPFSFKTTFSTIVPLTFIYGGIFTFIPSGIGGYVLELLIRARLKKGSLTEKWATSLGVALAGLAVILTCGIGLFVLAVVPHNGWRDLIDVIRSGFFFTNLPYYIDGLIKQVIYLLPEIIIATILACVSGGLAGKYLARITKDSQ